MEVPDVIDKIINRVIKKAVNKISESMSTEMEKNIEDAEKKIIDSIIEQIDAKSFAEIVKNNNSNLTAPIAKSIIGGRKPIRFSSTTIKNTKKHTKTVKRYRKFSI